jgi:hypothetical protein
MNDAMWLFEMESVFADEERRAEEFKATVDFAKKLAVNLLGLNLMPIEVEQPGQEAIPKADRIVHLASPGENDYVPLSIFCGRSEIVSEAIKRQQELSLQQELDRKIEEGEVVILGPDELDSFMEDEGDIMPMEEGEYKGRWANKSVEKESALFVRPMEEKDAELIISEKIKANDPKFPQFPIKPKGKVTVNY